MANWQVIWFNETTLTDVAGISDDPDLVSFTVAPDLNPVPARSVMDTVVPA